MPELQKHLFCSVFLSISHATEHLNFSISRLVKDADSEDEDNNNIYDHRNHHEIHRVEANGKITPHSEFTSSYKDSKSQSRSRSNSRSRSSSRCASRSCTSPELEVDSPPPPSTTYCIENSPPKTSIFQVRNCTEARRIFGKSI